MKLLTLTQKTVTSDSNTITWDYSEINTIMTYDEIASTDTTGTDAGGNTIGYYDDQKWKDANGDNYTYTEGSEAANNAITVDGAEITPNAVGGGIKYKDTLNKGQDDGYERGVVSVTYNGGTPEDTSDDIKINIHLANLDVNHANDTNSRKWACLPEGDTHYFYFTSDIAPGDNSSEFIEAVQMDGSVGKLSFYEMNFDLKINLDSVQVIAPTDSQKEMIPEGAFSENVTSEITYNSDRPNNTYPENEIWKIKRANTTITP